MELDDITHSIVDASIGIHRDRDLGPGLLEQVLTYLRLTNLRVGLLLNFGAGTMKQGIKRIVNDLDPGSSPRLRVNR